MNSSVEHMDNHTHAGMRMLPGWWVVFDASNDIGEIPEGFYINEERGESFHLEKGFLKNHLVRIFTPVI
jgi:hypothetical protein